MRKMQILAVVFGVLFNWTAAAQSTDTLTFALLTDLHVAPDQPSQTLLAQAVEEVNALEDVELMVVSGDICNSGTTRELAAVKSELDKLRKPLLMVPGNHETNWSDNAVQTFSQLWGDDKFFYRQGKYLFLGVASGPYLKMGDGLIKSEDLQWLKDTLAAEFKVGDQLIFVCHYPLNPDLSNAEDVLEILKPYPVRTILSGHYHAIKLLDVNGIPNIVGRAVSMRHTDENHPGYNIITINEQEVCLYNKYLGTPRPDTAAITVKNGKLSESKREIVQFPKVEPQPCPPELRLLLDTGKSIFGNIAVHNQQIFTPDSDIIRYGNLLVYNDLLIFGTMDSTISAIHIDSGEPAWSIPALAPVTCAGIIADHTLYMGLGRQDFAAINPATGEILWRFTGAKGSFQAAPAVRGDLVAFGAWDTNLYVLNRHTGKLLWSWNNNHAATGFSPGNVTPVIGRKNLAIVAPDRYLTIFSQADGTVLLRTNQYKFRESLGPAADGTRAYAKTMDGELVIIDVDAAKILQVIDLGIGYEHTPCPPLEAFGDVFVSSRQGDLLRINPATGEILWRYRCGRSGFNQLYAAPDNSVYAVMLEGKIYRIKP